MVDVIRTDPETNKAQQPADVSGDGLGQLEMLRRSHARERQALMEQRRSERSNVVHRLHEPYDQPG